MRSLRFSAWLLGFSGVVSALVVTKLGAPDVADLYALRIVAYAAFLFGGLGLWTLLSPEALREPCFGLAQLRGWDQHSSAVRFSALARHLFTGMCIAGLPGIFASTYVAHTLPSRQGRLLLIASTALYFLALAISLAILAALSRRLAPRSTRAVTGALIIVPFFCHLAAPGFPNLISLYLWGFEQLTFVGVLFT